MPGGPARDALPQPSRPRGARLRARTLGQPVGRTDHGRQRRPVAVVADGDGHPPVGVLGRVHVLQQVRIGVAEHCGVTVVELTVEEEFTDVVHHILRLGELDQPAQPGALTVPQRGEDGEGQSGRGRLVHVVVLPGGVGRLPLVPVHGRDADQRVEVRPVPEVVAHRTGHPHRRHPGDDKARVKFEQPLVPEPQLLQRAVAVVLDEHVADRQQRQRGRPALLRVEVHAGGELVAGVPVEQRAALVRARARILVRIGGRMVAHGGRLLLGYRRGHLAADPVVALDADDLRAQVAEQRGGARTGPHDGEVDDANAFQRVAHDAVPDSSARICSPCWSSSGAVVRSWKPRFIRHGGPT